MNLQMHCVMNKPSFFGKTAFLILSAAFFAILYSPSYAQSSQASRTLSLSQSIQVGYANSPLAQSNRQQFLEARSRYKSFRASLLPSFSLSANGPNFSRSIGQIPQPDGTNQFVTFQTANPTGLLSLQQTIPELGGQVSISSGLAVAYNFDDENNRWDQQWQSRPFVIGYTQPIFQFNNTKWRQRLEPIRASVAERQYYEDMENMAVRITQTFFDTYLAKVTLENAEFNVSVNDSIYNISQGRFRIGTIAENDLLQTELALMNSTNSRNDAIINYEQSLSNLKILLGIPADTPIDVVPPRNIPAIDVSVETAVQYAKANGSTFEGFRVQELEAERNFDQARKQNSFSANLTAQYGLNQTANSFDTVYEDPTNQSSISLGVQVPIWNWGRQQADVAQARSQKQRTEADVLLQSRQFEVDVEFQVRQLAQSRSRVEIAARADTIAQRRYTVSKNRYLIGRIDITNLFIAQNEKDNARIGYYRALRDFWVAWYQLRQVTLYDFEQGVGIRYD